MRAPERAAVAGRQAGGQGGRQGAQKKANVCVALFGLSVRPA